MKRYILNIHSFVDLITNSSTEIFVEASQSTIKAVKDMVNALLRMADSTKTADDLFEFSLNEEEGYSDSGYKNVSLVVKAKEDSEDARIAAKVLSNLSGIFSIEGCYNG